ncbi:MAG: PD-(D/E)XK nuclease family protein [Lachnospiraceae bacterium]|nr:PD-(D/E)XK nuclease family protein [Lachnospiraceae bacterium]
MIQRVESVNDINKKTEKRVLKVLNEIAYREDVNPFRVLRNSDHEVRHSNMLAWLLDKNVKNHGFGKSFAVKFFSSVESESFEKINWEKLFDEDIFIDTEVSAETKYFEDALRSDAKLKEEYDKINADNDKDKEENVDNQPDKKKQKIEQSRDRRIDILIVGESFTCTIENKYGSAQHDWQCQYYRYYINNKYSDKKNYFLFLDTNIKNWCKESLIYEGYELITYEKIIEILESLIKGRNDDATKFIKQYLEVLNEQYGRYTDFIEESIKRNFDLTQNILSIQRQQEGVTSRIIDGKLIFQNYAINKVSPQNDAVIESILNNLVKTEAKKGVLEGRKLIDRHEGRAAVSDPYGWTISVKNIDNTTKARKVKAKYYLNEIDYISRYGNYDVNLYFNIGNTWIKGINDENEFNSIIEKLNTLKKKGWEARIEYNIKSGYAQSGSAVSLLLDYEKSDIKEVLNYLKKDEIKARQQLKNSLISGKSVNEKHSIFKMLSNDKIVFHPRNTNIVTYEGIINYVNDYFQRNPKETAKLVFEWVISLEYRINKTPIVTDEDRDEIKKNLESKYYQLTKEGLDVFDLGEEFVSKIFKDEFRPK